MLQILLIIASLFGPAVGVTSHRADPVPGHRAASANHRHLPHRHLPHRHHRHMPQGGAPVPATMIPYLRQEPGQANRDWTVCRWYVGDTSWVICPDGYRISS